MKKKNAFLLRSSLCALPAAPAKIIPPASSCSGSAAQINVMIPSYKTDYKEDFLHDLQLF
ncbi:hypothetical protein LKD23_07225 [Faecalibacterium sp. CLA-AA-H233]|uniref:Uncharacterized protein n=1 Tax=Faecalibacterium butyricigenerans TaxID=1851427 RepID=A0ABS8F9U4_9FIRM|nr:hypothetical protein [Faecalibacterium sp. CLA-AA-H233]